jgi:phospholipase/carboxylesterase
MLRYLVNVPSQRPDTDTLPMVVMIHGRGADMHDLAGLAAPLDTPDGCRFLFPNAPKPFEPYPGMTAGWSWFGDWPPSIESVAESRHELLRFVEEVTAKYPTSKIVISGFSQGAMMSFDVGLRLPEPPAAIVALSGGLYELDLPDLRRHAGLPVLIAHGSNDDVVPVLASHRARHVLEAAGLDVELHEFPIRHHVSEEEVQVVRRFLAKVLAPKTDASDENERVLQAKS